MSILSTAIQEKRKKNAGEAKPSPAGFTKPQTRLAAAIQSKKAGVGIPSVMAPPAALESYNAHKSMVRQPVTPSIVDDDSWKKPNDVSDFDYSGTDLALDNTTDYNRLAELKLAADREAESNKYAVSALGGGGKSTAAKTAYETYLAEHTIPSATKKVYTSEDSLAYQMLKDRAEAEKRQQNLPVRQQIQGLNPSGMGSVSGFANAFKSVAGTPAQDAFNDFRQRNIDYNSYLNAADFEEYSKKGTEIQNPTFEEAQGGANIFGWRPGATDVGNIVTFSRDNLDKIEERMASDDRSQFVGNALYGHMTDDQVKIYNYILAKEGKEAAQIYLDSIAETLNKEYGKKVAATVESTRGTVLHPIMVAGTATSAGVDQYIGGVKQAFNEYELPTSGIQYAGQAVREDQGVIGKFAYDAISTLSNMAPSILASYVAMGLGVPAKAAEWVAAGSIGLGSGGNAYKQALVEGRSKDEAKNVAFLTGASEAVLSKLLSGISAVGGLAPEKLLPKVAAIEKSIWRVAAAAGIKIGGEVSEELLQLYLEPLYKTLIYGDKYDAPTVEEVAYTALLTMVTTGLVEGGEISKYRTKDGAAAAAQAEAQSVPAGVSDEDNAPGGGQTQNTPAASQTAQEGVQGSTAPQNVPEARDPMAVLLKANADPKTQQNEKTAAETQRNVSEESTGTKAPGFYKNDRFGGTDEDAEYLDRLAKAAGISIEMAGAKDGSNGWIVNGEVHLSENAEDPLRVVAKHEITHHLQDAAGEAYTQYRDYVKKIFEERGPISHTLTAIQELYRRNNIELTEEGALDELAADYAGQLLDNEALIRRLAGEDRTLAQRILDAIRDVLRRVRTAFSSAEMKQLDRAARLWEAALKETNAVYQRGEVAFNQDTRYAFADKKIPTFDELIAKPDIKIVDIRKTDTQTAFSKQRADLKKDAGIQSMYDAPVMNKDTGEYVFVTPATISHSFSNPGAEQFSAVQSLRDIIENAVLTYAEPTTHGADNTTGIYTLFAAIRNENGVAPVKLKVKEYYLDGRSIPDNIQKYFDKNGVSDPYASVYDNRVLVVESIEKEDASGSALTYTEESPMQGKYPSASSDISVRDLLALVNTEYRKYIPQERKSVKGSRELVQEIERLHKEGQLQNRSEEEVLADIRTVVDEVYQGMIEDFGEIESGEKPYRDVRVPRRTMKDNKVSQTVRTILEAQATPDEVLPDIEELVARGDFSYDVYSDKAAIADAESVIKDKGYATALAEWMIDVDKGIVSKSNTAQGWALYNAAVNSGDIRTAINILNRMVEHQHNAAQAVQATRILKKLSPDAQLYAAQRSVRNLQEEINKRYKTDVELKIDEDLAANLLTATTEEDRAEALRKIYRDIGKQVPSRFIDKWNAWRYLAMLGNVRTHVRNVVGNAGFVPVVMVKNTVATGLEAAANKVTGGKMQRSKALVGFGKHDMELLKAAFGDYGNAADHVGTGKYSDFVNMKNEIEEGRQIFKTKWLEKARKANSAALSAEDVWFAKTHYAYALAQYCKANGIAAQQIAEGNIPDAARLYAIKEAKKATYQDANQLSELFSRIGRYRGDNTVMQGMSKVVEGILPFRKTPANILARGLEYSPLGLIKTLGSDLGKVKKGEMSSAEMFDDLASNLTGSMLLGLGCFAALSGLVRGSGEDDDNEREFSELQGHQSYALELPDGTSVTLDWLAPECLPFFIGVNLCEALMQRQEDGEALTMADILEAIGKVSDPMLEMSCLQSLSDVFDSVGYASSNDMNPLVTALANATTSYLTQALPTILGQFERTGENVRMTTYTEKNAFLTSDMQYLLGKASSRIPGFDYNQIPYIDAWGRTEDSGNVGERAFNNMFNPAYTSDIELTPMEEELVRLYEVTGENVFPSRAAKYFNVDKARKDLTAEEYVTYATTKGQTAMKIITDLTESSEYTKLEDTDKAAVIELAYDLANAQAKMKVSDYQPDGWIAKAIKCCKENNIPSELYILCYQAQKGIESLKDKDGDTIANSKGLLIMQTINGISGLTHAQRLAMFVDFGVGSSVILYNPSKVNSELAKLKKK